MNTPRKDMKRENALSVDIFRCLSVSYCVLAIFAVMFIAVLRQIWKLPNFVYVGVWERVKEIERGYNKKVLVRAFLQGRVWLHICERFSSPPAVFFFAHFSFSRKDSLVYVLQVLSRPFPIVFSSQDETIHSFLCSSIFSFLCNYQLVWCEREKDTEDYPKCLN